MIEPLVSVHMITYNHEPYIRNAIESVLSQKTNFHYELVIGEDCSTDGTREIVFSYAEKYPDIIRLITSDHNVGMKKNSDRTRQACRGKYIAWCEGDDYWHRNDKLQMQVNFMDSHPEYGLVYTKYDVYNIKTKKIVTKEWTGSKSFIQTPSTYDILTGTSNILTCTVLAKRDLINYIIDSDPFLHQSGSFKMGDSQLWIELSIISKLFQINEITSTHLLLLESASQSEDVTKRLQFGISGSEMCLYLCQKHNLSKQIENIYKNIWIKNSLKIAFYNNDISTANSVRNKFPNLSFKNMIWYLGTKYRIIHLLILAINPFFFKLKK